MTCSAGGTEGAAPTEAGDAASSGAGDGVAVDTLLLGCPSGCTLMAEAVCEDEFPEAMEAGKGAEGAGACEESEVDGVMELISGSPCGCTLTASDWDRAPSDCVTDSFKLMSTCSVRDLRVGRCTATAPTQHINDETLGRMSNLTLSENH
jgi:hypothetical protein